MSLPDHGLSKAVWTNSDFEVMGWHDATIWAFCVQKADTDDVPEGATWPTDRLLLDLDYISRWVEPSERGGSFTFWVAPATLAFTGVKGLQVNHSSDLHDAPEDLEVADLHQTDGGWHVEGHSFDIRFRAEGFRQVFRAAPTYGQGQRLSLSARGGYSFSETPADL
jgi:hypothetical protein